MLRLEEALNTVRMERTSKIRRNGDLRGTPVIRVIASNGAMLGVMRLAEALRLAMKEGLDLVEVNPNADPPVCRILDFDAYKQGEKRQAVELPRETAGDDCHEAVAAHAPITWTPFECDGYAFEYVAAPTKQKTRPPGWPTHKASPGPWIPGIIVMVRKAGEENGPAMVFPDGTEITTEQAIEVVRLFWATLIK